MKNNGLFCSLFIENLKKGIAPNDAALGRMATLTHAWRNYNTSDGQLLWKSFLKQALSYLEFVPMNRPAAPGVYPLFEDWDFTECIAVLYLVSPGQHINDTSVGRFHPAKLLANLKKRDLSWGILTDGFRWRLYSTKSPRPYEDYVELALAETLENSDEAEYGLFERFFHRDSFILTEEDISSPGNSDGADIAKCRLDHYRKQSEAALDQYVKEPFLKQVDEVLQYICNGFIYETRKSKDSDEASRLEYTEEGRAEIFESAVKLIYRCLFLFYAEARRLFPAEPEQAELYRSLSMNVLCQEARKFHWGQRRDHEQYDLWKHLKGLIDAVNNGDPEYGIMGYDGGLFDDEEEVFLGNHQLRNDFLSRALYLLAFVEPSGNNPDNEYPIPYEDLEVRHLGELYENILEYTVLLADADRIRRRNKKGVEIFLASHTTKKSGDILIRKGDVHFGESALERKQTGSYYTPEPLVRFLNEKSIVQPLKDSFKHKYRQRLNDLLEQARSGHDEDIRRGAAISAAALIERFAEEEVFSFKICDPAMGSGHFLVDATNQMAGLIVALLAEVPYAEGIGADSGHPNYWRRQITRHCIYGVDLNPLAVNLAKLSLWLNCFAVEHKLTFLDHHLRCGNSLIGVRSLDQLAIIPERKKDRRKKKDEQLILFDLDDLSGILAETARGVASISQIDEDDTDMQKAVLNESVENVFVIKRLADLYTAYLMDPSITAGNYTKVFRHLAGGNSATDALAPDLLKTVESVEGYCHRHRFFHWPLEFPEVFGPDGAGGFSATVGNPPWDLSSANHQEFFSSYDKEFRSLNRQQSLRRIKKICDQNKMISDKWSIHRKVIDEQNNYFREPSAYTGTPSGRSNLYQYFLLRCFDLLGIDGQLGLIIPSGVYTDKGCQPLREYFFKYSRVSFLYCFENRLSVFNIHRSFKFVLLGIQKGGNTNHFKCAFMVHDPEQLLEIDRNALEMRMSDIRKFSPDTLAVMEFRNKKHANISTLMYTNSILLNGLTLGGQAIRFQLELMMNTAAKLFVEASKIDSTLTANDSTQYLPLYEGKMIWQYDAKWASPQYYVDEDAVHEHIGYPKPYYRLGFRDVTGSTNERTLVATIIPPTYHGNSVPTIVPEEFSENLLPLILEDTFYLLAVLNSFCTDFIARQRVTNHLNLHIMKVLPLPALMNSFIKMQITARVLRLICTNSIFSDLWSAAFNKNTKHDKTWYYSSKYGPAHEQDIRRRLREEAKSLTPDWGPHCGVHDRLTDRRDTGDRAQLRAEIDAFVAHLYGLSRDDFAYILDTFPVLRRKEEQAFGEFMSKRKCLEEYDRFKLILEEPR